MPKYGLNVVYISGDRGGPRNVAVIPIDAEDDAEAERQAEAVAAFAMRAAIALQIKVTITRHPSRQVINTIQRI